MRVFFAVSLLLACMPAVAKPVLTVTCAEPEGPRTDFYRGKFEDKRDGFSGVTPTFIFDSEKPRSATVLFGPAAWAKDAGAKDSGAFEAAVIVRNSEQISLVASTGTHIIQLYTLFPKKGIAYFTLHKYLPFEDGVASATTLISKCTFSSN
jgi:hypothetical protein